MSTIVDYFEDRQLITKRRCSTGAATRTQTNTRRWVYCLPYHTTDKANATKEVDSTLNDTPPPTYFSSSVKLIAETITGKELESSQHLFNSDSTSIQHPSNVESVKNDQILCEKRDVKHQEFIQHITKEKGERVGVEQARFDGILQTKQQVESIATQQDTSSQTKTQDSTLGQEAFQQKYQPVEVLNRDGEWVSSYYVHQCLVVANLEGIERKYAPFDKLGSKYAFLGQIRLPKR